MKYFLKDIKHIQSLKNPRLKIKIAVNKTLPNDIIKVCISLSPFFSHANMWMHKCVPTVSIHLFSIHPSISLSFG